MKKKILIGSISAFVLVSLISLLVLSTHSVNAADADEKYIAAKSGLNLRSDPNKSSKVVTLIPFGAKVTIEKSDGDEIFLDGRYGKWVNVKFGNKTGWLFSGYLCDFKPDTVIKPVADFYRAKNNKDEDFSKYKVANFKDSEVSIKSIMNNYIVLEVPSFKGDCEECIYTGDVVWRYDVKQNKFFEAHCDVSSKTMHLLYLDNDKYPDLVAQTWCCDDYADLEILLGSEKGFIKLYELPEEYRSMKGFNLTLGNCGDMEFVCSKSGRDGYRSDDRVFFRFNCKSRKVEKYAESKMIKSEGAVTSIDLKNMTIVIKDSKDVAYKLYNGFASNEYYSLLLKKLKKNDKVSFGYVTIDGKKTIIEIRKD